MGARVALVRRPRLASAREPGEGIQLRRPVVVAWTRP